MRSGSARSTADDASPPTNSVRSDGRRGSLTSSASPCDVSTQTLGAAARRADFGLARATRGVCRRESVESPPQRSARPATVGDVDIQLRLDPTNAAPTLAREAVDQLEGAIPAPMLDDLRLVISELVTNAVTHGPCREP